MSDSILTVTKKMLGLEADYTAFDIDVLVHINSVFATLQQLGVGPEDGFFVIDDSAVWADYIADKNILNSVKSYMYLKVRLLFDPPTTSFALDALNKCAQELEWRLNVASDVAPVEVVLEEEVI